MVLPGVSDTTTPGALLVARLHVDLCRLASAMCPPPVAARTVCAAPAAPTARRYAAG